MLIKYYRTLISNRKSVVLTHLHAVTVENLYSSNMVNNVQNASPITNERIVNTANTAASKAIFSSIRSVNYMHHSNELPRTVFFP